MNIFQKTCLGLLVMLPLQMPAEEENWQKVSWHGVDKLFPNPGQGWMTQERRPTGAIRFPCSVVYLRFDWADIEPQPGQYHWELIDDVIAAWQPQGVTVALRVMTANAHSRGYYSSPKWLFDSGCHGFEYHTGGGDPTSGGQPIPRIEPDYADPLYLARQGKFITTLGKRYNGSPNVEFLDIGSYGIWGEWHTTHPAPTAVRQQIVDMYVQAFPQTPLVFMTDDADVLGYALAHGTGMRRDGVGSPWHEQNWIGSPRYAGVAGMAEAWKKAPVVFEWFGNYDYLKSKGWSFDAAVNFMLNNHVNLINDNLGQVPPEARPQLEKLARLAGYRFVLLEVANEKSLARGHDFHVKMTWANVGVGRLWHQYVLKVSLRNSAGAAFTPATVATDPREWLPGVHNVTATVPLPANLAPGDYHVAVALMDPTGRHQPLNLAMDAPALDGWYLVNKSHIE